VEDSPGGHAEGACGFLQMRLDLAQGGGERQHHHRQEHVQRADDDGSLGVQQADGRMGQAGRQQQPVEQSGRTVAQDQLPAIGAHDDADDQRRDGDERDDPGDGGMRAHHDHRHRITQHRR
jgi:hypothetical protein